MDDILIAVSSPPELDLDLFLLWCEGKTDEQAYKIMIDNNKKKHKKSSLFEFEFPRVTYGCNIDDKDLVKYEVYDQFRAFELLEHFLSQPLLLKRQCILIINDDCQSYFIIDHYWHVDNLFIRDVLNKKLQRSRKDLEDVSELTGLNFRSITRQFDNIKRIYNAYEDRGDVNRDCINNNNSKSTQSNNNLYTFINKNFLLSSSLSTQYACIIFLLISRFNLSSKKRLLSIDSKNLELSAALILAYLVYDSNSFYYAIKSIDNFNDNNYNNDYNNTDCSHDCNSGGSSSSSSYSYAITNDNNNANSNDNNSGDSDMIDILQDLTICWSIVWKIFPIIESNEIDKQLLINLRDIRSAINGDILDYGCKLVRQYIGITISNKIEQNTSSSTASSSSSSFGSNNNSGGNSSGSSNSIIGGGGVSNSTISGGNNNLNSTMNSTYSNNSINNNSNTNTNNLMNNNNSININSNSNYDLNNSNNNNNINQNNNINSNINSNINNSNNSTNMNNIHQHHHHNNRSALRVIIKSLLQIGANLSQAREYRDLFEDLLMKIAEPLEEYGLDNIEIMKVIHGCYYVISDCIVYDNWTKTYSLNLNLINNNDNSGNSSSFSGRNFSHNTNSTSIQYKTATSSSSSLAIAASSSVKTAKIEMYKKDWLRFIIFVKLCVNELIK